MRAQDLGDILGSLYDGTPDAILLYDRDGCCIAANGSAGEICGYRPTELVGMHVRDQVYAPDRPAIVAAFEAALAGLTQHVETTIRHRAGTIVPVECELFPARANAEICGVFAQLRDVVALRAAELSLGVNRERFRSLFEYHPDGVMSLREDGTIVRMNPAMESATGFRNETLGGRPWTELFAPEAEARAHAALEAVCRGETPEFDALLLDRLGNRIDVQCKLVPLHVGEQIDGAYVIVKDVSAQRAAERAVAEQTERLRELYLVAARRAESGDAQIESTLRLGCRLFGFSNAYVTRVQERTASIQNAVGGDPNVTPGKISPRAAELSQHVMGDGDVLDVPDLDAPPWDRDPARKAVPWRSYFAVKLVVNAQPFGALVFADRKPRIAVLSERDRDLAQLMALFLAATLEREQHAERIEQLAFYDALTGLPNRVLFGDRIRQTLAAAKRYGRDFAIMYLDLDHFKQINDNFGHATGDLVLKAVGDRLVFSLRESDTVARFGGDEFVILQPVINGTSDAADLARKILRAMQEPVQIAGCEHCVRVSIGIALYPQDGRTQEDLTANADRALYLAKGSGRNRWSFASDQALREVRNPNVGI